jgi:uncharacterized SAM-binding protein YcdF (DUF218 family)
LNWFATNLVSTFLLPPFNLILLGAAGVLLLQHRLRLGKILITTALTLFYLLSIPIVADALLQQLETPPARNFLENDAQAIVVLGGGTYYRAPEYGGDTVGRYTLERIRYAAKLHRATGRPILVTGGAPLGNDSSEASEMKAVLEKEFQVPVQWMEEASRNTLENAKNSFTILKPSGLRRIILVTHAWHMPRASTEFKRAGFDVLPAATAYTTRYKTDLLAFIPNASALLKSSLFFHEVIGTVWYGFMSAFHTRPPLATVAFWRNTISSAADGCHPSCHSLPI